MRGMNVALNIALSKDLQALYINKGMVGAVVQVQYLFSPFPRS